MVRRPLGYVAAFDGLRGLAVLAVMAFHAGIPLAVGGFLGVDAFFVLSGFLITSLLCDEHAGTGTIDLPRFYVRRALRLLPALVALLGALQLYSLTFVLPEQGRRLGVESLAALFYVANWAQAFGVVPPLGFLAHTWSLSIEEQFYLTWPLALRAMRRRLRATTAIAVVALLACASAALRAVLWHGVESFPRVFFGFDTRADAMLLGCLAALAVDRGGLVDRAPVRTALGVLAPASAVVLVALAARASWLADYMYQGGFSVAAAAVAVILLDVRLRPSGATARALSAAPLVGIGRISYGLYLWHWPIFLVLRPEVLGWSLPATTALRFVTAFLAAAASYALIESRFLAWKSKWRAGARSRGASASEL